MKGADTSPSDPRVILAGHVATLGRGPGRSRSLDFDEAREAMSVMLSGQAEPEAVGALLMLLRMKGETADEIAGIVRAAQENLPKMPLVDLDWPSYAAGRTRGLPWFLLSARLVASAGHRVFLHGWNGHVGIVRDGLAHAGITSVDDLNDLEGALARDNIAYMPLENLLPSLFNLLQLRNKLGLRSCINTVCRMLNPAQSAASVQGVFHPSYRLLQADAGVILGWNALSVIKGGGGEFERHPSKSVAVFGLRSGVAWDGSFPAISDETRRLDDGEEDPARLGALWSGEIDDDFSRDLVLGTASAALDTLGISNPDATARELWEQRLDLPRCS